MPAFRKGSEFVIKHVENGNNVHNQRTYAVFPTCAMLKGSITVGLLMNGLLFSYKTLLNVTKHYKTEWKRWVNDRAPQH